MIFLQDTNLMVLPIYVILLCISLWFNKKVAKMEEKGQLDGIKALLVAFGIAYVLFFSVPLIGLLHTLLLGGGFFFALAPMVYGEVSRFLRNREATARYFESIRPKKE